MVQLMFGRSIEVWALDKCQKHWIGLDAMQMTFLSWGYYNGMKPLAANSSGRSPTSSVRLGADIRYLSPELLRLYGQASNYQGW